jgi:hypothetical protein
MIAVRAPISPSPRKPEQARCQCRDPPTAGPREDHIRQLDLSSAEVVYLDAAEDAVGRRLEHGPVADRTARAPGMLHLSIASTTLCRVGDPGNSNHRICSSSSPATHSSTSTRCRGRRRTSSSRMTPGGIERFSPTSGPAISYFDLSLRRFWVTTVLTKLVAGTHRPLLVRAPIQGACPFPR